MGTPDWPVFPVGSSAADAQIQLSLKKASFMAHLLGCGLFHVWQMGDTDAGGKCPYLSPRDG